MLSIRLSKIGKKNRPAYRIVVAEKRSSRNGRALDYLGHFDPYQPKAFKYDEEKYSYWIKNGAQPTASLSLLIEGKYKSRP